MMHRSSEGHISPWEIHHRWAMADCGQRQRQKQIWWMEHGITMTTAAAEVIKSQRERTRSPLEAGLLMDTNVCSAFPGWVKGRLDLVQYTKSRKEGRKRIVYNAGAI